MKKAPFLLIILLSNCQSQPFEESVSDMGLNACNCYNEAKSYQNYVKTGKKLDECYKMVQEHKNKIQKHGERNDLPQSEVMKLLDIYGNTMDSCENNN